MRAAHLLDSELGREAPQSMASRPIRRRNVLLGERRLDEYAGLVEPEALASLRRRALALVGLRVLHLTVDPFDAQVAETLSSLVPLQRDLGLVADWQVLEDAPEICGVLYRGLAGEPAQWDDRARSHWHAYAARCAATLEPDYDVVVVHDPQLLNLPHHAGAGRSAWIWHCHLDPRGAPEAMRHEVQASLGLYDAVVSASSALTQMAAEPDGGGIELAGPAIDPWAPVNRPLSLSQVTQLLADRQIDPRRPIAMQLGPLQAQYGVMEAIEACRLARRHVPGLQLVLAEPPHMVGGGSWREIEQVLAAAADAGDVRVFPFESGLQPLEVNAIQCRASVVLQLAAPNGFGWGLLESLWKGKPLLVGQGAGLSELVADGGGTLRVDGPDDAAEALVDLRQEPGLAFQLGKRGRRRVIERHLITRLVGDYLDLLAPMAE